MDWLVFIASYLFFAAEQFQQTKLTLPLDVLAYASPHSLVCCLPPVFIEGIVRQLHAMVHCLVKYSQVLPCFYTGLVLGRWFIWCQRHIGPHIDTSLLSAQLSIALT